MSRFESFCLTVMIALAVGLFGFVAGRDAEREAAQITAMKNAAAAYAKLVNTNNATVERERELRRTERAKYEKYYATQEKRNSETDKLVADLRRDVVRLRVPIRRNPQTCTVQGGSPAAGTGDEGHAELSADASVFLVGLLQRGDNAIAKHAEVVDRYDRLAAACSTPAEADHATP